jgi:alanine racemase
MIRPTQARIDVAALRENIRTIRRRLKAGTRMMAVVKANCYGHGVEHCVPTMRQEGVDLFGVATVEEGARLRGFGLDERIVVLPPPLVGQYHFYPQYDLEALVSDVHSAEAISASASASGTTVRVHLHVDTGMTRNGVAPGAALELARAVSALPALELVGVASHFATSDEADLTYALLQRERFDGVVGALLDAGIALPDVHLSNSGGVLCVPDAEYSMVRPGLALYGYHPDRERQRASGLRPVLSLHTAIGGIASIDAGVPVSYGRSWTSSRATTIATLPIGYADGLMRTLSNRFDVLIDGVRYPAVGRISMDETMIDVGRASSLRPGAPVVLIGRSGDLTTDAWDLAATAGTIPYEICTSISSRVPRVTWEPDEPSTNTRNQ